MRRVLRANRYTAYDGQMACYEASTHYSRSGVEVAPTVAAVFPWVRVVALLRDPISRAASMLVHMYDKNITSSVGPGGCLAQRKMDMGGCLLEFSQISNDDWGGPTNYSTPLKAWLDAFPSDQVFLGQVSCWHGVVTCMKIGVDPMPLHGPHARIALSPSSYLATAFIAFIDWLLQFEALTAEETERQELVRVKKFLGLNPNLPKAPYDTLGLSNSRKGRINPDGWPMQRNVYEDLVKLVRPDCEAVAALVDKHGLGDGSQWMANWEAVWQRNLDTCDDSGSCLVQLS